MTWTLGRKWPIVAPAPCSIAWVARGVVMKRPSSAAADGGAVAGQRHRAPHPLRARAAHVDLHQAAFGEVVGHAEGDRHADAVVALDLLQGGGVALEDALALLGHLEVAEQAPGDAVVLGGRGSEQPQLLAQRVGARSAAGQLVAGPDDHGHLVLEERVVGQLGGREGVARADRHVDGAGGEQRRQLGGGPHAQLHVEVLGPAGEELDQPGGGVLGEQARRGQPQEPAARGPPRSPRGSSGPAGPSISVARVARRRPARGEADAGRAAGEERVVELLAQHGHVARHRRLGHPELGGGRLHRAEAHHGGERPQLRGGHGPHPRSGARAGPGDLRDPLGRR